MTRMNSYRGRIVTIEIGWKEGPKTAFFVLCMCRLFKELNLLLGWGLEGVKIESIQSSAGLKLGIAIGMNVWVYKFARKLLRKRLLTPTTHRITPTRSHRITPTLRNSHRKDLHVTQTFSEWPTLIRVKTGSNLPHQHVFPVKEISFRFRLFFCHADNLFARVIYLFFNCLQRRLWNMTYTFWIIEI